MVRGVPALGRTRRATVTHASADADLAAFAEDVSQRVERWLELKFARELERLAALRPRLLDVAEAVRDLTLRGGKRLRAVLVAAGYAAARPTRDVTAVISAGAAFELLQSYFLIHDDWMDGDVLRRGGPTVHVALSARLGSNELGASAAILAGDYAVALAQQALAEAAAPAQAVLAAMRCFAEVQADTVFGQVLDITADDRDPRSLLLEDLKTGSYTVRGPLLVGALLGEAQPQVLDACARYARPLGIAFQLRDDVLGLIGSSKVTGKPAGTDIRSGKRTTVLKDALDTLTGPARDTLNRALGKLDASDEDMAGALRAIVDSGAIARSEARIAELRGEAMQQLDELSGLSRFGGALLTQLANRLTARQH